MMRGRTWTNDEDYELKLMWPREDLSVTQIAKYFGRCENSVRTRALKLRLERPSRRFLGDYDDAILKRYIRGDEVEDIARHYGVTVAQMNNKIQRIVDRNYLNQRIINRKLNASTKTKIS